MRSLILQQLVTVDGFVAGPSGELDFATVDLDFSDVDRDTLANSGHIDTILLGANTYRMFVEYWPTADEPIALLMNAKPKVVVSTTLEEAPWGHHEHAEVVTDLDAVRELKLLPGGDIVVFGSITLSHALLRAGLVDELQLRVCPVLIGDGKRLLPPEFSIERLEFGGATVYNSGIVATRYLFAH